MTKGPKDYRDNLSIIRLLQEIMFRIAKKFWFLMDSTSQRENYCIRKASKIQSSRLGFHGDWAGVGQAGFVFLMRQNLFGIPVFNFQTDELYLLRCLYRNEIAKLKYLGWKFHVCCQQ